MTFALHTATKPEGDNGLKKDEVIAEWRRLDKEKLYDLYSSPNIIRVIK